MLIRGQLNYVCTHCLAERIEVVTTFQTGNQSTLTTARSPLFHGPRHVDKIFIHQQQLAQRISEVRIKTRRDDDQVGTKVTRHLIQGGFKASLVFDRRRGRAQWKIQRVSKSTSSALLATRAGTRIPGILVRRKEEDCSIAVEDSLRAVAVMHVPVDDRHLLDLRKLLLRVTCSDGHVVKETDRKSTRLNSSH